MGGVTSQGGYAPAPDGEWPADLGPPLEMQGPYRVVGIGLICDRRVPVGQPGEDQHFSVSEFVRLDNGGEVILHRERGFTWSAVRGGGPDEAPNHSDFTQSVLNTVLPDDDADPEEHPWEWLAEKAQDRGLTSVTADDLRHLPYEVVLTDAVRKWLTS